MPKKSKALEQAEIRATRAEDEAIFYARILGAELTGRARHAFVVRQWRIIFAPSLRDPAEYSAGTVAIFDLTRSVDGRAPSMVGASYIGTVESVQTAVWSCAQLSGDHAIQRLRDKLHEFELEYRAEQRKAA